MTQRNLVEGGARRGTFQTRHNRIVRIKEPFTFTEPLEPGKAPVSRTCWKGDLFMGDARENPGLRRHLGDGRIVPKQAGRDPTQRFGPGVSLDASRNRGTNCRRSAGECR